MRSAEQIREAKRLHMARRRAADPDAVREYQRIYHQQNRERQTKKMRDYYKRRFFWGKAMKLRGAERATFRELARLWRKQKGLCALTGRRLDRTAHLDHIVAKVRGGADRISNLRWVDPYVNLAKRDMSDAEWFALCGDVMRWIGERIQSVKEIAA